MENSFEPFTTYEPGGPITAEDRNRDQVKIKEYIAAQTQAAVDGIERVPNADNADKLEEKTLAEITEEIVQRALSEIPKQTGYLRLFLKLEVGEEKVVEHGLKACPLVDLYQLDYFKVGASEDGYQFETWVNFYLYHSSERRLRFKDESEDPATLKTVDIEPADGHPYRIPFKDMLDYYGVEYTEDSSLGDVETEFWKAFFADPNDDFDDDQQAHSPWFDRCCRENLSVQTIRRKRDWDDIWFQMRPRRTVNYPYGPDGVPNGPDTTTDPDNPEPMPAPTQIEVAHFDFNTLGLRLLRNPV
ncbi:MAG: hypothetical protein P8186_27830, partial [Anaerolineae bacterium]